MATIAAPVMAKGAGCTNLSRIKKFKNPKPAELENAFERLDEAKIRDHYDSYLSGTDASRYLYELPTLEIVHSSDVILIRGSSSRCASDCACHDTMEIKRRSREYVRNYMGYNADERCYVFTGQRRLFPQFLKRTAAVFKAKQIETAYLQPRDVAIPLEGVNPGYDYEQFAKYIETLDCILFLPPMVEDPLRLDVSALDQKVSPEQMNGPASYGLLVEVGQSPSDVKEDLQRTLGEQVSETEQAPVSSGKPDPAKILPTSRYALRDRRSNVQYK
ncbi:hypothetical protein QQS21_009255 [Conoideocrella luteorostrata]|uniref:Uncharacterized protein n=1 Tax=Conoideocrella luteorostrata TaxID=1105319 RepID=A0AAJ0CK03_9HYPO|nr:hypothetical protein QQS21_009255 [Conoideocrella luteorostrata]